MTTTGPEPSHQRTPDTEPEVYEIPEAEKLAAQWEARHDLAAGRRSTDPMHVQHYLAHVRSEEALHEAGHPSAAAPRPRAAQHAETPATGQHSDREHGSWRRWAHHG